MNDYIKLWIQILETMNNDNTYKLAWGKALLEIILEAGKQGEIEIGFEQIGHHMLKYYWNQIFFFQLRQSPANTPVVIQQAELCIRRYTELQGSNLPVWFDRAERILAQDTVFYSRVLRTIAKTLREDVSWRFLHSKGDTLPLYVLDKRAMTVAFTAAQAEQIREYAAILAQLLNYRWAELLERFNNSPRILSKVKGISQNRLRRSSLSPYRKFLLAAAPDGMATDFYTGQRLDERDITVDHVIPWSFLYSDDIWNLVLTSRRNNSGKSNRVPEEEEIVRLEARNRALVDAAGESKYRAQLSEAIEADYVRKLYLAMKL